MWLPDQTGWLGPRTWLWQTFSRCPSRSEMQSWSVCHAMDGKAFRYQKLLSCLFFPHEKEIKFNKSLGVIFYLSLCSNIVRFSILRWIPAVQEAAPKFQPQVTSVSKGLSVANPVEEFWSKLFAYHAHGCQSVGKFETFRAEQTIASTTIGGEVPSLCFGMPLAFIFRKNVVDNGIGDIDIPLWQNHVIN